MVKLKMKKNANEIFAEQLKRDNFVATFKVLEHNVKNNYKTKFFQELQILITKIGIALADCYYYTSLADNKYLCSIDFICNKVVGKPQLYKVMKAIEVNSVGNKVRHSNDDVTGDIEYTLKQYHNFLTETYNATKIEGLKKLYIHREKNKRDEVLIPEKPHHKFFMIKNVKFQLKINENYIIDPYSKNGKSKVTLFWPIGVTGHSVDITVKNGKNNRIMKSVENVDISKNESKHALEFNFKEDDLDRRVLSLEVSIKLFNIVTRYLKIGIIFKKSVPYEERNEIASHVEKVTQLYSKNNGSIKY